MYFVKTQFPFCYVVYVLGLQHELAQIMHVFWLSKHDAHYSVTEKPYCALPVCFCGHHVYEEFKKNDLLSEENKF